MKPTPSTAAKTERWFMATSRRRPIPGLPRTLPPNHGGRAAAIWLFHSLFRAGRAKIRTHAMAGESMRLQTLTTFGQAAKRQAKSAATPVLLLALMGIFAWQATQGNHGLIMRSQRQAEVKQAESNLATAKAERDTWERKVAGLTASHLDKDALDQRARELLNLADPSEIVVQYGPKEKLF
ncbi:MAG: septum formation initiator family protein [Acetobacteraceae bacterium]|nr:septum formation initiator family protein [Acetobacteraceae bacterium]